MSLAVSCTSGVPQGSHLDPILFNIFINDLVSYVESAKCLIYADDVKVYNAITSVSDAISLQMDFSAIHNWSLVSGLPIKLSKCNVISFHRKKVPVQFNYTLNQHQVQQVVTISDLGIIMDSALTYQDHIEAVIAKALKLVGFIKRSTVDFKPAHTIKFLYRSIVLPVVTYGSVVGHHSHKPHLINSKLSNIDC